MYDNLNVSYGGISNKSMKYFKQIYKLDFVYLQFQYWRNFKVKFSIWLV